MPTRPVQVTNDFAFQRPMLTVASTPGPLAETLQLDYRFSVAPTLVDASWNGIIIDTLECLVVPANLNDSQGMQLNDTVRILATQTVAVAAIPATPVTPATAITGEGSVVLPTSYFGFVNMPFVDSHRTWTLLMRTRGCIGVNGYAGASEVLSCLAIHAEVQGLPSPLVMEAPSVP
jgi:hypothetical protein